MNEKELQILDDQPIDDATFFNFDAYVEALTGVITRKETKTPLVVGIFGDWGSGKTSLMLTLEQKIKKIEVGHSTIWFNAWKFDKEDVIWRALLMRVLEELKTKGENKKLDEKLDELQTSLYKEVYREELGAITLDWGKAAKGTLRLSLSLLPYIGDSFNKLVDKVDNETLNTLSEAVQRKKIITNIERVQFMEQFHSRFKAIIKEYLIKQNKRAVIFIDDLDRCVPEKAIEVLEAIKLFLDVEGCIFILGIDRRVISEGVRVKYKDFTKAGGKHPINGDEYIEKIIQLGFMLPPILDENLKDFINHYDTEKSYENYHDMIIKGIGRNPRKIKRFINAIKFQRNLAEIIPEIKKTIKPELKQSFDALLIEWQIINSSSNPDYIEVRKQVLKKPEFLLKMHIYSDSRPSGAPSEDLEPFWKTSIQELIEAFPYKNTLKEDDIEIIEKVIHLSSVTDTAKIEEVLERKPMTRQEVLDRINKGESLEGTNLSGINLEGENLIELNFSGANLHWAKLSGTNLNGTDLSETNLKNANLEGATLIKANLRGADLTYAKLRNVDLTEADLSEANLKETNLYLAVLSKVKNLYTVRNLMKAKHLNKVDLSEVDFAKVDFTDLNLSEANLSGAKNLREAKNLSGINLSRADLTGADLKEANLSEAKLNNAIFNDVDLSGANLTGADLSGAKLSIVKNLREAKGLSGINLTGADLTGADLTGVCLKGANLSKAKLVNADLTDADLSGAKLVNAEFNNTILEGTDITSADLSKANLVKIKTHGIKINDETKTNDIKLVKSWVHGESGIKKNKEALAELDEGLRKIILRDNPHIVG
jgi:uncharacterized protein YjbI with pentapeptide repeats